MFWRLAFVKLLSIKTTDSVSYRFMDDTSALFDY